MTRSTPTRPKKVTLSHVAREAGVAVSTASAILRGEVTSWASKETRKRVLDAAAKVQYRPNQLARALRVQESRLIGLVFSSLELTLPSMMKLAEAERYAMEAGYQVMIRSHHDTPDQDINRHLSGLLSYQVAGIVLMPGYQASAQLKWLASTGVPGVTIDAADAVAAPNVTVDRVLGGYMQVQHMLGQVGCKRLLFLVPGRNRGPVDPLFSKLKGIRTALKDYGSSEQDHLFFDGVGSGHTAGYAFGRTAILETLEAGELFDGVVATSDAVALTALHTLEHAGLRVPDDVAVIGFDDQEFAAQLAVPLSTIRQPKHVGRIAMEILLEQIDKGRSSAEPVNRVIQPELIVRASTTRTAHNSSEKVGS